MCTYYTAVGNFRRKRDDAGQAYSPLRLVLNTIL